MTSEFPNVTDDQLHWLNDAAKPSAGAANADKVVTLGCFGFVVRLTMDPDRPGLYLGGQIESNLITECEPGTQLAAAFDAIESLVLAHACAGVDVQSPAYQEGIEVTVGQCANKLEATESDDTQADVEPEPTDRIYVASSHDGWEVEASTGRVVRWPDCCVNGDCDDDDDGAKDDGFTDNTDIVAFFKPNGAPFEAGSGYDILGLWATDKAGRDLEPDRGWVKKQLHNLSTNDYAMSPENFILHYGYTNEWIDELKKEQT